MKNENEEILECDGCGHIIPDDELQDHCRSCGIPICNHCCHYDMTEYCYDCG
jgi:hypothetical protein